MDHDKFQHLVKSLYSIVEDLEEMFPGRHFTPDGHMVGSLGECLVDDAALTRLDKQAEVDESSAIVA